MLPPELTIPASKAPHPVLALLNAPRAASGLNEIDAKSRSKQRKLGDTGIAGAHTTSPISTMTSVMQERPSPNQSSESESRQSRTPSASEPTASGNNGKKRASRAGTRSVTTLSAAQLERKRANDREAQRAIRQRTKEHIEKLERRIVELSSGSESNEQLLAALKRNKELEEENAVLRANLDNFAMGVSESPGLSSATLRNGVL